MRSFVPGILTLSAAICLFGGAMKSLKMSVPDVYLGGALFIVAFLLLGLAHFMGKKTGGKS
jgi:hypothetical protein